MKYFKNTSWLFVEKILRMVVGLFIGVWVARYLGPDKFGLLSYAQSFVGLFSAIATLGLEGIVVRELVNHPHKENELIGTAFYLKLLGAFLTLIVLYIAIYFTSNDHFTNVLVFIIASTTIFQSFNVVDMYFQSKVMSKYVVYANIISLFISSLVKIILILINAPLIAFAWVVLFDSFVLAMGFVYFFIKHSTLINGNIFRYSIKHLKFNNLIAVKLLRDSWSLILSGMVISIYMKIDQVMLKEMLGNEAVGKYAVAVRLSEVWYFIPVTLVASMFPAIVNSLAINKKLFYSRIQKLYNMFFLFSLVISLFMYIYSQEIILLLFGKEYIGAHEILSIYIWATVFVFHGAIRGQYLIALNKQVIGLQFRIVGLIVNVILNYIFIEKYGVLGAAYATVISFLLPVYLLAFKYKILREDIKFTWKSYFLFWLFGR
jgi:O-antigen/teichoic acid export membrane protein